MATTSTNSFADQIRARLMTAGGLEDVLSELWIDAAPDTAVFPYGIMRVVDDSLSTDYDPVRKVVQLEVMIYGNKRSQAATVEDAADLCDQAMVDYVDSSSGLVFFRDRSRSTAPATGDPAFRESATVRLLYELVVWPLNLNTED